MRDLIQAKALKIQKCKSKQRARHFLSPSNQSTPEMQIIEYYEKFIGNWRDAKTLSGLYEGIINYVYLIWDLK